MDYFFGGSNHVGDRKLRVRIGPSTHTLTTAHVNNDEDPVFVDSPFFSGNVLIRVKDFKGVVPKGKQLIETSPYFEGKKRLFSIQVQGRFKHDYPADDIYFGAEFDKPVSPPTGAWMAIKFAQYIDPALKAELYADKPWFWSPLLASMNVLNVIDLKKTKAAIPAPSAHPTATTPDENVAKDTIATDEESANEGSSTEESLGEDEEPPSNKDEPAAANAATPVQGVGNDNRVFGANIKVAPKKSDFFAGQVQETAKSGRKPSPLEALGVDWKWHGEHVLNEDTTLLFNNTPKDEERPFAVTDMTSRRKFFGKEEERKKVNFTQDKEYVMEIFAPFINMNTFDLTLGININLLGYLNHQPIRMVAKSWRSNQPLFVIEFDLVQPEHLDTSKEYIP